MSATFVNFGRSVALLALVVSSPVVAQARGFAHVGGGYVSAPAHFAPAFSPGAPAFHRAPVVQAAPTFSRRSGQVPHISHSTATHRVPTPRATAPSRTVKPSVANRSGASRPTASKVRGSHHNSHGTATHRVPTPRTTTPSRTAKSFVADRSGVALHTAGKVHGSHHSAVSRVETYRPRVRTSPVENGWAYSRRGGHHLRNHCHEWAGGYSWGFDSAEIGYALMEMEVSEPVVEQAEEVVEQEVAAEQDAPVEQTRIVESAE